MWPTIPTGFEPWQYYAFVGAAVLVVGIAKAGFGGGIGILAIPLMAIAMGPTHMLGVMLPLLIACDIFSNLHYRREQDWGRLRPLLIGAAVGVGVGTVILFQLASMPPEDFRRIMTGVIGGICLAVVILQVYRLTGREVPTLPTHPASAMAVGLVAGALSTLNHAAGPIIMIYLLQEGLAKRRLVGTMLMYFLIGNTLKLPTFLFLPIGDSGQTLINASTLRDSIWFLPLIPIGTVTGAWMNKRIPEKPFAIIMYTFAAITAGHMLIKALG